MSSIEINNTIKTLKKGGVIVYPTDTVWGIGCDATNYNAVQKIFKIKKRDKSKAMICLVNDINMLKQYVEYIPDAAKDILKHSQKPTTIIYDKPKHIAENLISEENTLAFRIVKNKFCQNLIQTLNKPIVSTSANTSGKPTPITFKEIEKEILKGVDYVVNLNRNRKTLTPSSIIKLSNNGKVKVVRP